LAVRLVARQAREFITAHGWGELELSACELALVEACNNALHHIPEDARHLSMEVEVLCDADHVEIRVLDHTAGFEWPDKIELPADHSEGGRGLFLIASLMDRVVYFRNRDGNCMVMSRGRIASAPEDLEKIDQQRILQNAENELMIRDMLEELSSCYDSISTIFRYSSELVKNSRVSDFSHQLLNDLLQITAADWFVLRLKNGMRLVTAATSEGLEINTPLDLNRKEQLEESLELKAGLERQDHWFDQQKPLNPKDPLASWARQSQGFAHPLVFGEELIGTLTIGKSLTARPFTSAPQNVVHTFADFLAIQVVNARFQEEVINNRLVSRELEIAKNIQRSLLPKELPQMPGFSLAGFCESARQVGGDFYDVLRLSSHSVLLVIADVMGKGIPASMFAATLRILLRAMPELTSQPSALMTRVNHLLFAELSGVDMFITAALVYVNIRERRLVTASAGHCPVLIACADQPQVKALTPEGMPLGILPDTLFQEDIAELKPDSRVFLYTDGLADASNTNGESFGQNRLIQWLKSSVGIGQSAGQLKQQLIEELTRFQTGVSPMDDQTFLILAGEPSAAGQSS